MGVFDTLDIRGSRTARLRQAAPENLRARSEQASCSYACASQAGLVVSDRLTSRREARRKSGHLSGELRRYRVKFLVFAAGDDSSNDSGSSSSSAEVDVEALESRLGLGRRARREGGESKAKAPPVPPGEAKKEKKWEEMSILEQAWSLYIGEKGFLFWLNKLAYASIFLVIGGWIVFRFVGPALGWYELDSPLLSPSEVLG
ncbi:hypothetical protein R1sor_014853 [Riccia sorocarpa]|uniref:Uncharacterized protein n=1 Tax=Riccia sorocarpa TaxID=122646 RepID=A0ABD3HDF3_9MARC